MRTPSHFEINRVYNLLIPVRNSEVIFAWNRGPRDRLPDTVHGSAIQLPSQTFFNGLRDEEDPLQFPGDIRIEGNHRPCWRIYDSLVELS